MASVEKRSENTYRITVSCGYDTNGKKLRKHKTVTLPDNLTERQREKEIQKQAVLFEKEVESGTYLDGEKITFTEFAEIWLRDYAERQLAPKTLHESKRMLELRIIPALGHIKLSKLQPSHLIKFYNNLSENGVRLDYKLILLEEYYQILNLPNIFSIVDSRTKKHLLAGGRTDKEMAEKISIFVNIPVNQLFKPVNNQKGLSSKTIHNHHSLISSVLTTAVQWQVIVSNPCDRVKPPKKTSKEAKHYDDRQTVELLSLLDMEPVQYKTFIYLAIFTGARLGELSALSWDDVDFENQTLKISKSLQYLPGTGTFEKSPKTERSNRTLYLSDYVIQILRIHRLHQTQERLKSEELWQDKNKVFTRWNGDFISPCTMTEWFRKFIRRNNLPPITFHQLRHTNATIMISEGIDVATISKRLGHSQASTTVNIYSHALQKVDKIASNKLEDVLLNKKTNSRK